MNQIKLGTFEMESGLMMVSDPCYSRGTWCQCDKIKAKNGVWHATVNMKKYDSWGERCASLTAIHESIVEKNHSLIPWYETEAEIGVDSGQAGIYDSKHYTDRDADSSWYEINCNETCGKVPAGIIPHGCVSASGFGDGSYELLVKKDNDEVIAAKILFNTEGETIA